MSRRRLPTSAEAAAILARKRTRPTRRAPPPMGRSLNRMLKALDERFGQGPGALQARWQEIVGADIAKRTEPVKLSKPRGGGPGALEIRVAGPSAAFIQHQAPEIVARVNMFLGQGAVNKLRIIQGPLQTVRETVRIGRRKLPPLDAALEAQLSESLETAPDGPLKAALLRLGRGVLRGKPNH